jgi:hypothetical protein
MVALVRAWSVAVTLALFGAAAAHAENGFPS